MRGKKIAFCGIGRSNLPLLYKYSAYGARVTACDRRNRAELHGIARELEAAGITLNLGDSYLQNLDADIIFRTPGMNFFLPELVAARRRGVAVTSEMEEFFYLCPSEIFAVTGSDGKTTTTTLISEMLKAEGKTVHLGGNIGKPLLPEIENVLPDDFAVVELSSFQLISMRRSPDVAVVTNLAPNHLDVHSSMEEYIDAKKNIFTHQNAFSRTVLNLDNGITRGFANETRGQTLMFSRLSSVEAGAFLSGDGTLYMAVGGETVPVFCKNDILLPGEHNIENYLAAISAVWGYVSPENMKRVAQTFAGVEHRIEFVREINGVKYYNDSIATSPTRSIAALNAFGKKVVLLAGGYDKHIPFEPMAEKVNEKVKLLILTGTTASAIEKAVTGHPAYDSKELPVLHATDLAEAVRLATENARPGDIVILSPASASFDAYPNFEERGKHFKELVSVL
jgi:UDP-N-acetylmuramoylalanine--D-glutamate ligase